MIKSVGSYPISQMFDIESSVVYVVPRYQREYTWSKSHWENLFDDVLENDPGYFLGSIICINQSTDTLAVQKLEVVDGQQRLTTISLLFAALYQCFRTHQSELDEDQRVEWANLKRKLVLKKGIDQIRVVPQIQNNNQGDYCAVLAEIGVISDVECPAFAGNRRIVKAFRYFQTRIDEFTANKEQGLDTLSQILDKMSKACLVKIEVASHADAYTLFESLNDRGVPLTAIDLIKNKLLAKLESLDAGTIDYHFGKWNQILRALGDDYTVQERFFRQYYNAFKSDLNAPFKSKDERRRDPLGVMATRSNLIQIYEKLINRDAKECLSKISVASRLYSIILSRSQEEIDSGLASSLKRLERIQGAPSYLLLLYLLDRRESLGLTATMLSEVVDLLVRFFVRRNLTDTPPTRDLIKLFMNLIEDISFQTSEDVVEFVRSGLLEVSTSDEIFRTKLEGPIYDDNADVTRFILCTLEEQAMTRESQVDLWQREGKLFIWTIEHIFPQGENIPQAWIDMIADGDENLAKQRQASHVHKLGNLTISGFNATLGNKSFLEKRDRTDRKGRPTGYKNGLRLNDDLARASSWSIQQIDERTRTLVDATMELFTLN
ncbi:MAG: DUF262 and DUF1524 domain-containing protein [Candidatus Zixiibacteriota bacterium]